MFSVDFTYSPWFLILCVLISGGLTFWMYRNLKIELPKWLSVLLNIFRFVSIFILLLLLLEPLFTAITEEKNPPIVVVLQDGTESMLAHKDSTFVKKEYPNLFKSFLSKLENGSARVQSFVFGSDIKRIDGLDSVKYRFTGTDMSNAIEQVAEQYANQNLAAIVCISDGIPTSGKNPVNSLDQLKVPVFTALIGDTTQAKDLVVESVLYNEISYLNTETPIQVNVRGLGIQSENVKVTLTQRGKVLQSQNLNLSANNSSGKAIFNVKLSTVGLQQYEVHLNEIKDEISYQNNHQYVFIKVLETRLKIALFGAGPHPDIGALKKTLLKDERYLLTTYVRKSESEFYENNPNSADFSQTDAFIFCSFPSTVNDKSILDKVYAEIDRRKVPIIHFAGSAMKINIHPRQKDFMGIVPERITNSTSEAFFNLQSEYKNHSTYRFEDESKFRQWINSAPPILRSDAEWKAKGGTQVFGKAKIKGLALDYPIFGLQENNGYKNMVFVGENLWRYRTHNFIEYNNFDLFDEWTYNLIQWLTTKSDNRRFKVFPTKNLFIGGESVVFKGQTLDDSNKPISGAEIKTTITDPKGKKLDYTLKEASSGSYSLDISNLEEGAYSYIASGVKNGLNIGSDLGEFSVGRSAIEFVNLKADAGLMKQLANRTDGNFVFARDLNSLADQILKKPTVKPLVELRKSTQTLNKFLFPVILILTLLSLEWILRKRFGLL